jgi:hypothetical protein
MEAVRTSETSGDNQFTRQYNPEDSSEHHTRRRENLKSHEIIAFYSIVRTIRNQYTQSAESVILKADGTAHTKATGP